MDLVTSTRPLAQCLDAYDGSDLDVLATALASFRESGSLCELLRSILDHDEWFETTLSRSYIHPNGFAKIVLVAEAGFHLRLHIWHPALGAVHTAENIHSHRWDFASILVVGGYRYQEFAESSRGRAFHAYTYHGHQGRSSYGLTPIGIRHLQCTLDASLAAGTRYTLSADALHRVVSYPEEVTASLVLQGPHRPNAPVLVFADAEIETGMRVQLKRLSKESFVQQLRDLITMLA
jgi:hypothetical protein